MSKTGQLIVFSGPSGVGKGTLLKSFLTGREDICYSISATTRPPREGEQDGKEYYFVSKERFLQMVEQNEMLEHAQYAGNYYGTPSKSCQNLREQGKDVVLEIEVQGALHVKELCPDALMIFVMPPSLEVLQTRLTGRGTEEPAVVARRLTVAREELKAACLYDFVIVNDNLQLALQELAAVVCAGRCRMSTCKAFLEKIERECAASHPNYENKEENIYA